MLCSIVCTQIGVSQSSTSWNEILEFAMPMCDIPRSARLCFNVFGKYALIRIAVCVSIIQCINIYHISSYRGPAKKKRNVSACYVLT